MKHLRRTLARAALAALLTLTVAPLTGCGGGGGTDELADASGAQGLRFAVDPAYHHTVQLVDITAPGGASLQYDLSLSAGQEMFIVLPEGNFTLRFWIDTGGNHLMADFTERYATVAVGQVSVVHYP